VEFKYFPSNRQEFFSIPKFQYLVQIRSGIPHRQSMMHFSGDVFVLGGSNPSLTRRYDGGRHRPAHRGQDKTVALAGLSFCAGGQWTSWKTGLTD
jgi:hypothetical protein